MKRKRRINKLTFGSMLVALFCFSSCGEQWGLIDPPAGNQVYPRLEQVLNLSFEEDLDPEAITLSTYEGGELPVIVSDDSLGNVLHLNGGYVRIPNPLLNVKVQNGVSFTFWAKQSVEDGDGALLSFQNEDGSQKMFFTANGQIDFNGVDYSQHQGEPSLFTAEEWQYVAVAVTYSGYNIHINGVKVAERIVANSEADYTTWEELVQFMATAPNMYISNGSNQQPAEWWLDDLIVYRNTITGKEQAKPVIDSGAEEFQEFITVGATDFSTGWWSAFSDAVNTTGNGIINYKFKNFNSGGANNW
ncbi:MAG: LamG domain-containing protein [Bacteroidales bacterium]|nr:LamG domain-containing protein [Bacteroidales bacterium]